MKKRKWMLAAIALTLGFTACTQDDTPEVMEQEIRIAARSEGGDESGTTTAEAFTRDFNLDLWSNDNPNKYERHAMHHDGTSWNVVKTNKLYDNTFAFATTGKGMDLNAVENQYFLSVYDRQETSLNVDDFDVMYAYNPSVDTETPLDLEFKHLFTKLTVNIEYGSEFTTTPQVEYVGFMSEPLKAVVTITGIGTDNLQFDYTEYEGNNPTQVIDYGDEADMTDDKVEVIVGIGTLPAGYEFIRLYDRFGTMEPWKKVLVPEGGLTFEAGKHYTFDLKVGKDKVTLIPTTTSNFPGGWDKDTETDLN